MLNFILRKTKKPSYKIIRGTKRKIGIIKRPNNYCLESYNEIDRYFFNAEGLDLNFSEFELIEIAEFIKKLNEELLKENNS